MRVFKRIVLIVVGTLVVMIAAGAPGVYWFMTKSHPQIDGTVHVAGLQSKVEILRDPMDIPHIYAANQDDLFFAEGYVQAQDQLWQMEYNCRSGHGTLSEIFGVVTVKRDRLLRTIGLNRAARANVIAMSESEKRVLQAFANGANAFITTHRDNLPLEFAILGFTPAPWELVDTVAWGAALAYGQDANYGDELLRATLIEKLGLEKAAQLMPPYPATGPFTIPPEAKPYSPVATVGNLSVTSMPVGSPDLASLAAIQTSLGLGDESTGSNNWVVDGTKSTTGKPLLATDPHLGIQMPSVWYEVGLHCTPQSEVCPYNVVGYTFPGVPGVATGHNDRIAWGYTSAYADVQDLYIAELNPENPNQHRFNGEWQDMQVVDEPIRVKGGATETLKVQITRHGPIITPLLGGAVTQPLALQWTVLREPTHLLEAVLAIDRAQNRDDFRNALRRSDAPTANFLYADADGNIGSQMPGHIPIRAKGNGAVPVPGTGEFEWTGYIPFDELPFVYNPPTHFLAAANQAIVPSAYKYWITGDWSAPYRKQRIDDLLKAKQFVSPEDMQAVQVDVYSLPLVQLQQSIVAVPPEGSLQTRAMEQVKLWDGRLTADTIGGTILQVTYQRLFENIFSIKMDKDLLNYYRGFAGYHWRAVLAILDDPSSEWWGSAGRDAALRKSYAEAVEWLRSQFGDTPGGSLGPLAHRDVRPSAGQCPAPQSVVQRRADRDRGWQLYAAADRLFRRHVLREHDHFVHANDH